ncbi:hypothetical protein RB600_001456 [Gaeumannomyces tritici]
MPRSSTAAAHLDEPSAHLTVVNSYGHIEVQRDWLAKFGGSLLRATNDEASFDQCRFYCMVKLLALAPVLAIARSPAILGGGGGTAAAGREMTLGREFPLVQRAMTAVFQAIFARTAEQGAKTLVSATALGPESHGRFWNHDVLYPASHGSARNTSLTTDIKPASVTYPPPARALPPIDF